MYGLSVISLIPVSLQNYAMRYKVQAVAQCHSLCTQQTKTFLFMWQPATTVVVLVVKLYRKLGAKG